jgi:hypothetical protein
MLVAYAVVDRQPPEAMGRGLGRAPLVLGGGPYLLGDEAAAAPPLAMPSLHRHHQVAVAASRVVACLPCRFGAGFRDESAALDWLEERRSVLQTALARVEGHVEYDLRDAVAPPTDPPEATGRTGPGTMYLEQLRARQASRDPAAIRAIAESASRHLGTRVADVAIEPSSGIVAFLVRREHTRAFADAARSWLPHPGARWSGPWPAYTFAAAWIDGA